MILVEPDQRISWANDAALAMHGVAALSDLGATVDAYRARFSLRYRNNRAPGRYPIERVLDGETFRDVVVEIRHADRPGLDFVHSLRSLVVTDAGRRPTVLALIIKDISAQFEAEERFESAFNANPAPAVIVRLSVLCLVRVNAGFLEITGYARDRLLGRSVYEVDLLAGAHGRERALEHLTAGEPIPHREALLRRPDGGDRAVIVAGQPIVMGELACMLFTFADLEPRRKAETALRQSEERFAKAFRLTPHGRQLRQPGARRLGCARHFPGITANEIARDIENAAETVRAEAAARQGGTDRSDAAPIRLRSTRHG